jgi:hypothetical protein
MVLYSDTALHIGTYSYKSVADNKDEEDKEEKRVAFICQCTRTITSIAAFENYWDNFRMVNKNQRGRQPGSKTIVRLVLTWTSMSMRWTTNYFVANIEWRSLLSTPYLTLLNHT